MKLSLIYKEEVLWLDRIIPLIEADIFNMVYNKFRRGIGMLRK